MIGRSVGKVGPRARRAAQARAARNGAGPDKAAGGATPAKKKVDTKAAWRDARALMWQHRRALAIGFSLMLVSRVAGLVLPLSSKGLIDEVIGKSRHDLLWPIALGATLATLVQAATGFALSQVISVAAQRAISDMRRRVLNRISRLPVRYFDEHQTGVLISRVMNDAEGIRNLVGTGIVQLVGGIVTAVLALGVLLWLNWVMTLVIVVILAGFGGGMAMAFGRLRPIFRERGKIQAEVTGRLNETLGGIRVVKAYGTERREQVTFAKGVHRLFRNIASSITGVSATTSASTVVIGLVGLLILGVGGPAVIEGTMTLGDLITFVFFVGLLAAPVVGIASIGTQISEAIAGLDRIREILILPTEIDEDVRRAPLDVLRGDVAFEDVWFEYREGQPVLKDVNFTAPAGSTTALVGSSGSGKSTLVSLVMAFNRPTRGRVLIDGRDLDAVRLTDYRARLGVVLQDNFLFDGTVAENIAFSRPSATREEVEAVARLANCDEFVKGFPQAYDTVVGERGVKLSGGQRQRIAIARALLADPGILILDEATSSLDSESEALIQEALARLRGGRTTFVIAHRLSTIRSADQILVLENGEIVERGSHDELMALGGRYRTLHDKQYAWESNRFTNPGEDFTTPASKTPAKKPAPAGR
ncbi:ABC transporter ATP-binding protein [Roseisolibacter agri]|uniref:ABC transporter ATP-binding protein n=1 Tax=Roseisolibacter agri TaxID=2014610 RepID=A0AA37VER4_9BACT|nr:ABC transporter ATP-binding protein [Roseisolibacter agri]GLC25634.1 ABC transporter ATP-binding protein [Roseisolibacter agri]